MTSDPLDTAATPPRLTALGRAGFLTPEAQTRALALAIASPPRQAWLRFLSRALLLLGALLSVVGVVFFFAYNWASLPSWGKFALLEGGLAAIVLAALRPASPQIARQVALLAGALLVGPLLGVYGQTYQTGADPWGLFALWAALILPWSAVARAPALWLLQVALVDVAVGLWFEQTLSGDGLWFTPVFMGIQAAACLAWELLSARGVAWMTPRWWPRLMAAAALAIGSVPSVMAIFGEGKSPAAAGLAAEVALLAVAFWVYRERRRDLFVIAASLGTVIVLVTAGLARLLFEGLEARKFGILLLGGVVVGEVALAVGWLRRLGASRETD